MSALARRVAALRDASPSEGARLVYRKAIHRKVFMGQLGGRTGDSRAPNVECDLEIDIYGPDKFDRVLGTNPYLDETDLGHFRDQESRCIVVLDRGQIVASSWMTHGDVHVHDLHRSVLVPDGQHFSCRSFVGSDYGGRALMSHMIHTYAMSVPADDEVWGLLYPANVASIRSCERIGWLYSGDYWTRFVFGRKVSGERHFASRPAMDLTTRS